MNTMQAHGTLLLEVTYCTAGQAGCLCGLQQGFGKAKVPFTKLVVLGLVNCSLSLPACKQTHVNRRERVQPKLCRTIPSAEGNAVALAYWRGGWPLAAACKGCMLAYYSYAGQICSKACGW